MEKKLKITLVKSRFGRVPKHGRTLSALGLRKINQVVVKPDNPQTRGMVKQVDYLVKVVE
ncbi:MAG: 50S ribosomal protein L30 [bacterium]|nr:50S ribosomal protein L30 [bacterium]